MWKKFAQGIVFGLGASIAFFAVLTIVASYVIPATIKEVSNRSPDMSGGHTAEVVPLSEDKGKQLQEYKLYKGNDEERKIPPGGGMLSIAVLPKDSGLSRPSTFQAWVTETNAYIISTEGAIPVVKEVPFRSKDAVSLSDDLVSNHVGFVEQNLTMPIDKMELERIKRGDQSTRDDFYNGDLRVTSEGVVFLMPNEYEHR